MEIYIANSQNILESIETVLFDHFSIEKLIANRLVEKQIKNNIDALKPNLWFVIETDYVDKVYRDSYYFYYSGKRNGYKKDCIKISIFDIEISGNQIEDLKNYEPLYDHFLGYFTLRPTPPAIIGRSVISPRALRNQDVYLCYSDFPTTSNSIKFQIEGFPHSSQDSETITCAETSLWAMMEYFGTKYPDYKPLLPSHIINILKTQSNERQLPSRGQAIYALSYTLKELGFGPQVYSREQYGEEFEIFLSMYIESGIPLILGIDNKKYSISNKKEYIGHAVLCIGRKDITDKDLKMWDAYNSPSEVINERIKGAGLNLYDWHDICNDFVFMDDNRPAYQVANIAAPTEHYNSDLWRTCSINHFVAPLYKKIYLEAQQARDYFIDLLASVHGQVLISKRDNVAVRMFLTSSRSYKDYIIRQDEIAPEVRKLVSERDMGKFIWVAEISTKELLIRDKVNGFILLDATEPSVYDYKPFIIACHEDVMLKYVSEKNTLGKIAINLQSFSKFNNLKLYN